jgi:DNA-binding PadR family transcriptional regulator
MVEKGLLTIERRPRAGKGYYTPTRSRAETVAAVLDDVTHRLAGQPLGYVLTALTSPGKLDASNAGEADPTLQGVIAELKRLEQEDNKPIVHSKDH